MSEGELNEGTILDYLNADCWRAVLGYVPITDVIRSERVSRDWQNKILAYLRSIFIGIGHNPHSRDSVSQKAHWLLLKKDHYSSFKSWTKKLGTSVVACVNCGSEENLKVTVENCPNLRAITVSFVSDNFKLNKHHEYLRKLQLLHFNTCCYLTDDCVTQFTAGGALEELDFVWCNQVTGQFLPYLKSSTLKSLGFHSCHSLSIQHLLVRANHLSELTKLELFEVNYDIFEKLYLLLDQLTNLEHLDIESREIRCDKFYTSVCSLSNLRLLSVNYYVTDEILEAVMQCCQKLETLDLRNCYAVTGRGLAAAAARARGPRSRLAALGLRGSAHVTDDDVVACVRACPNLQSLDVSRSPRLTLAVAARAAAARRDLRRRGATGTLSLNLSMIENWHRPQGLPHYDRYKGDGLVLNF